MPEPPPTSEVRLYLTERLDEYIALRDDDIRYWRKLSNEGGTLVWVRADLKLYRYRTHRDEARYLAGDIADAHLPGAASDPTGGVPARAAGPVERDLRLDPPLRLGGRAPARAPRRGRTRC